MTNHTALVVPAVEPVARPAAGGLPVLPGNQHGVNDEDLDGYTYIVRIVGPCDNASKPRDPFNLGGFHYQAAARQRAQAVSDTLKSTAWIQVVRRADLAIDFAHRWSDASTVVLPTPP